MSEAQPVSYIESQFDSTLSGISLAEVRRQQDMTFGLRVRAIKDLLGLYRTVVEERVLNGEELKRLIRTIEEVGEFRDDLTDQNEQLLNGTYQIVEKHFGRRIVGRPEATQNEILSKVLGQDYFKGRDKEDPELRAFSMWTSEIIVKPRLNIP